MCAAQHKTTSLLKTLWDFFPFLCHLTLQFSHVNSTDDIISQQQRLDLPGQKFSLSLRCLISSSLWEMGPQSWTQGDAEQIWVTLTEHLSLRETLLKEPLGSIQIEATVFIRTPYILRHFAPLHCSENKIKGSVFSQTPTTHILCTALAMQHCYYKNEWGLVSCS